MSKERVDGIAVSWDTVGVKAIADKETPADAEAADVSHVLSVLPSDTESYAADHGGGGASCCTAFPLLLARTWREFTRNKFELALQIGMNIVFSALFGVIYFQMPFSQTSIMDRTGLLFFQAMNGAFGSAINTSTAIPSQLQVVQRERTAGMYSIFPFYAATFVALIPLDTLPVLFNAAAIYWVANLRNGMDHFFIYAGLLCLEYFVGISLGMLISALIKNVEMAPRVAPAFVILFLMFSGFFLNDESVPVWAAWLKHISFIRYTFQGLCVNEFGGAEFPEGCPAPQDLLACTLTAGTDCSVADTRCTYTAPVADDTSTTLVDESVTEKCISNGPPQICATGDNVLEQLSFDGIELYFVVMMNLIIGFAFHFMVSQLTTLRSLPIWQSLVVLRSFASCISL